MKARRARYEMDKTDRRAGSSHSHSTPFKQSHVSTTTATTNMMQTINDDIQGDVEFLHLPYSILRHTLPGTDASSIVGVAAPN